jgi:hypothetical protein
LVTEHTIEENILSKAQQKRNLDILVMDQGKFDTSLLFGHGQDAKAAVHTDEVKDVYTKGGLRAILGVDAETEEDATLAEDEEKDSAKMGSAELMENAMTSLEDADDVVALRGAQKEVADELKEFDESIEYAKESDAEGESDSKSGKKSGRVTEKKAGEQKNELKADEAELEEEFASWQDKVGMDESAIEASLSPVERYGLRFRTEVDPFISIFAVMEERRKLEADEEADVAMDVDEIEKEKEEEELRAMEEGDLLATFPQPEDLIRQRALYMREKSRQRAHKKLRKLTGQDWDSRIDGLTKHPFWYNIDTGEAVWDKPDVLIELEAYDLAHANRWSATPKDPLVHIMSYLSPFPDRMRCAQMCRQWHRAAFDSSFVRHVYPVEMGAHTRDDSKMDKHHYRSIADALKFCLPGDNIGKEKWCRNQYTQSPSFLIYAYLVLELGDGHYWANEDVVVDHPIRLVGDEHNPSNVVIEMSGTLIWKASGGFCEGITFRRPKLTAGDARELLRLESGSRLDLVESVLDNEGANGDVVIVRGVATKGNWRNLAIRGGTGGLVVEDGAHLSLTEVRLRIYRS